MQNLNFSQSFTTRQCLNTTGTVLDLPLRPFLYITDDYCALLYLVILHYGTLLMSSIDYCALRYISIDYCRFRCIPIFSQAALGCDKFAMGLLIYSPNCCELS